MKSLLLFTLLSWVPLQSFAADSAREAYDLVRYTPPAPWNKIAWTKDSSDKFAVSYTHKNLEKGTYCQIFILKSTVSKGGVDADFASEWQGIVVKSYGVTEAPTVTDAGSDRGWTVKAGVATFAFAGGRSIAMLTTVSGFGRAASVVALTSDKEYLPAVQKLLGSIEMQRPTLEAAPSAKKPVAQNQTQTAAPESAKPQALQGYMDYNPFTKSWTWRVRYPPK